ncbi:uncharacterized protein MELLADRAFT_77485 [Melampsora larici-populina 98AG31]|uniref:DM2 domain-containing protein n=1 Tax=Melampsora larici-populina (strain 98AG31 / pathotype 3-4-7) TaxID=747676 RepID=F4RI86_MELLP|nr:uncharacterized protein MELLADRAFT_77485 [Melampsora larici-populina 98AG31]EGG08008.1 hypothetical protein MELLADRAFT_77485 [Melampsora larici-populina 98AG31]
MSLPSTLAIEVRSYLNQPDVDLQLVSAKQIRRHLTTIFPSLDTKLYKTEIDGISIPIFHEVQREIAEGQNGIKKEEAEEEELPLTPNSAPALGPDSYGLSLPSGGIPGGNQRSQSQSQEVLSYSIPRSSQPIKPSSKSKPTPIKSQSRKRKSAAFVESEDDEPKPKLNEGSKPKKPRKPRAPKSESAEPNSSNKGIHKEMNCSPALGDLIGVLTCSRPQVVKKIWEHIKANDLQDPKDKRQIICDEKMKAVFNVKTVHMFTMNKLLGDHLWADEEVLKPKDEPAPSASFQSITPGSSQIVSTSS